MINEPHHFFLLQMKNISYFYHANERRGSLPNFIIHLIFFTVIEMHNQQKLSFYLAQGEVEGILVLPDDAVDMVVITNGHNGFYSYGMFPSLQQSLAACGIASFSYNFSHGGIRGEEDTFSDLVSYEKNCMRLETADLIGVMHALHTEFPVIRLWMLSHSMGAVPNTFAAATLKESGLPIAGLIYLAPVSKLDFWPQTLLDEWKEKGSINMLNKRTGQELPHGPELLQEITQANTTWNMQTAVKNLGLPVLVIHGGADESVSTRHGQDIYRWAAASGSPARYIEIGSTGHTFGATHPFTETTEALESVIQGLYAFISDYDDKTTPQVTLSLSGFA